MFQAVPDIEEFSTVSEDKAKTSQTLSARRRVQSVEEAVVQECLMWAKVKATTILRRRVEGRGLDGESVILLMFKSMPDPKHRSRL